MIRGTVIGTVWATRKHPALEGAKLALVASPDGRVVVARDALAALAGEEVIVAFGSGARNAMIRGANELTLADCAIAEIVDGSD